MPGDDCIFAFTDAGRYERYPAYINVTKREKDGVFVVTVRSRDTCGTGVIELSRAQLSLLTAALNDAR